MTSLVFFSTGNRKRVFAYARQIRAMNLRDLLMRRRGAAGRNFDDHMKKFRHFIRCHHPVLSILRHGLNRKSTVIVYQFHGDRYHFEREIAFVANGDRSTYSFALFAAPITPTTHAEQLVSVISTLG
jgi:hypothetical protein